MQTTTILHNRYTKLVIALLALTIGGIIYIGYRPTNLAMFNWFETLGLSDIVELIRQEVQRYTFPYWIIYNIPAGLWLLSYMLIIDAIWDKQKENGITYILFTYSLAFFAIISELLQFANILPGTFDILDLLTYILTIFLFITTKTVIK